MTSDLAKHTLAVASDALTRVAEGERSDTYVVSFFISDEEDDPRRPTLTVGTNTETQVSFATHRPPDFEKPNPWWTPTSEAEARWNYAFWLQNRLAVVGDEDEDPAGATLRERWVRDAGLWCEEPSGDDDWDEFEDLGRQITAKFVGLCIEVARTLHQDGALEQVFGRPVPIVIHELEYHDEIAAQTSSANPRGLADDFVRWVQLADQ